MAKVDIEKIRDIKSLDNIISEAKKRKKDIQRAKHAEKVKLKEIYIKRLLTVLEKQLELDASDEHTMLAVESYLIINKDEILNFTKKDEEESPRDEEDEKYDVNLSFGTNEQTSLF